MSDEVVLILFLIQGNAGSKAFFISRKCGVSAGTDVYVSHPVGNVCMRVCACACVCVCACACVCACVFLGASARGQRVSV